MECEEAADKIEVGDEVEVDFSTGVITNKTKMKLTKVNHSQNSYKR